jgi:stage V sporulation protein AE
MDFLRAFLVGGGICLAGQLLINYTKLTPARILVFFVVTGAVLSALNLYEPFVKYAGAGATVPISGFGHLVTQGVKQAVDEKGLLGVLTGGLAAAAAGITATLLFGFATALVFKPKDK